MDAPLNEKIERTLKRKAARKKNDSNFLPVLSLHEQVLSLVKEANSKVSEERHVTPRSALIVMNRSLADLSTLDDEARNFAVLKEVSRFLNVATKTFTASETSSTDLLVAGHPLSALNASLSAEEFLTKNAAWIAADPSIEDSIRPLVASAHASMPGSIEREHAFTRLAVNKTILASYFKLDNLSPIVAAFSSGNSSAARRARVALQWRDKKGRWVEMGRGVNFRFRLPDGSIQVGSGNYVGAGGDTRVQKTAKGTSLVSDSGLIEVSGVPGLAPGLYVINSNNAVVYQARIPGHAAPEKPSFKDQLNKDIPSLADLTATRKEMPIGWKKQGPYLVSDDNYAVIPGPNGQPYSVLRLDANGRPTGEAIARVSNWTEVNAAINKDEPAFDKYIAKIKSDQLPLGRIPDATAKDVINPQDLLKMQEQRMQENKAIDAGKPAPTPLGNNDLNGNPVPDGWVRDQNNDRNYTREMPLRDGGTYPVIARLQEDGTYIAGHAGGWIPEPGTDGRGGAQKFDSWDQIETQGLPGFVDYLNGTFTKDNPIIVKDSTNNNQPFDMAVSQRFIDERFPKSNIDLVGTTREGRNSYMLLDIPEDKLQDFKDSSGFDNFKDKENFTKLPDGTYKLYTDFSELNANLDNPVDSDKEPPAPPSGGTPPKTPSPNAPSAPELFNGFNVPDGAFKFNTVEYSPEGRIDEASRDFTDDPKKLATKFTPQELVQAMSQALLGNSTDAAIAEILNANVDDSNDIVDPADIQDNVDIPQVNVGQASGAGELEFSAGSEFVPAEALFNAIWEAGLDPNRVVANIYDSANGNNDNLNKLIKAQGGVPSAEEARLVDDIMQEIRQLKDASAPGDSPIANQKQSPSPDPLPGSLIENIPIDFNNPDYYIPNSEAYIPSQPTVDENGYTDNPEILSADYEVADLLEQMLSGITDGSGAALLAFDNITVEVPIEAMRDALQYQDINTNQILLDLKKESNNMSDSSSSPVLQAHSQMIADLIEQTGNTVDSETADKIRDAIDEKGLLDWSEAKKPEIIDAITEVTGASIFEKSSPAPQESQPAGTSAAPIDSPENVTPQFAYPGPRENGYSANNTILDSNGAAVGAGARVQALSDGRAGTVVAVQNIDTKTGRDADYVRIRFDDGTTAVRSARQIFGIDAGAPVEQGQGPGQLPPARRRAVPQDPSVRFNEPAAQGTPVIAGNGDIPGVKLADTPQELVQFTNPNAKQADYTSWGLRAPEIARAGRERVTADSLAEAAIKVNNAIEMMRNASTADERAKAKLEHTKNTLQLEKMVRDTFGVRDGIAFGREGFTLNSNATVSSQVLDTGQAVRVDIRFFILERSGRQIGTGSRTLRRKDIENPDGTFTTQWHATNDVLKLDDEYQEKGFASSYNRYMENWYIANGFDRIKVHAYASPGWEGGYVWALNGFNWEGAGEAARVPAILRKMASDSKTTEEEQQIIKGMQKMIAELNPTGDYTPETVPTPLEIAQIGAYAESAKTASWAGKRVMLKHDWYGVKNLNPGAIEQRQALNYGQMGKARKRIEDKLNRPNVSRELVLKFNSNEFADANPELTPYIDYIRDVFRNNRSLAVLSPGAKTALNRFVSSQLLKGENKNISLEDIIKLRTALDAEFKADNPLSTSNKFGVGDQLLDVSMDDVRRNNIPGFTTKVLGMYESGSNDTYMVTHNDSGQVFFVKKDSLATQYNINGAGAEVQADAMLRASGIATGYETRVSNADPEIIVMQRAGAGLPLLGEPMTASNALNRMSVTQSDGTTVKVTAQNLMDLLHTPEDAIRIMLIDLVISNMDRHNGNILFAVDGTDTTKIRILPIDHALSSFGPDNDTVENTVLEMFDNGNDNIYGMAMSVLTQRLKQEELLALFRNEARTMMEGLSNPANLPTGKELDLVISNFGSLDEYRKKIQERLDAILQPGGEGHQVMLNVLKPVYWAQR
jgi:hypothetical protein